MKVKNHLKTLLAQPLQSDADRVIHEAPPKPVPKSTAQAHFEHYLDTVRSIAAEHGVEFIDALAMLTDPPSGMRLHSESEDMDGSKTLPLIEHARLVHYDWLIETQHELLKENWPLIRIGDRQDEILAAIEKLKRKQAEVVDGGNIRADQLRAQKQAKYDLIKNAENNLATKTKPRALNKAIAKLVGLETDYVRQARKAIADKKQK